MKTEYNGYRLVSITPIHKVLARHLLDTDGISFVILSNEQVEAIHILGGDLIGCSDENCPCHEAGRQKGLETPGEPQRNRA